MSYYIRTFINGIVHETHNDKSSIRKSDSTAESSASAGRGEGSCRRCKVRVCKECNRCRKALQSLQSLLQSPRKGTKGRQEAYRIRLLPFFSFFNHYGTYLMMFDFSLIGYDIQTGASLL